MSTTLKDHRDDILLEATLAATAIGVGLTQVRRYSFTQKGFFHSGLVSYTVGVERLLKLAFVVDRWKTNGYRPTTRSLKNEFGHGIEKLVDEALQISARTGIAAEESKPLRDEMISRIVKLLDEFAKASRYFNLDRLTDERARDIAAEPLAKWDRLVNVDLLRRHHRISRAHIEELQFAAEWGNRRGIVVSHVGDDGRPINHLVPLAHERQKAETKSRYAVLYLLRIVEFGALLFEGLVGLDLAEPFRHFCCQSRQAILRRKNWVAAW